MVIGLSVTELCESIVMSWDSVAVIRQHSTHMIYDMSISFENSDRN